MSDISTTSLTTKIVVANVAANRAVTPTPCGNEEESEPDILQHEKDNNDGIAVFNSFLDVEASNFVIRSLNHEMHKNVSIPLPTNPDLVFGCDISLFCKQDGVDSCENDLSDLAAKVTPVPVSECIWIDLDADSDADDKLLNPFIEMFMGSERSCVSSCSYLSISSTESCSDMSISSNESTESHVDDESSSFPSIQNEMGCIGSYYINVPKVIIAHRSTGDDDELTLELKLNEDYTHPISKIQNDSLDRMEQAMCFGREDEVYDIDECIMQQ